MSNYSMLKHMTKDFLNDVNMNDTHKSFQLGIICGFYMENNKQEMINKLEQQLNKIKTIINSGLIDQFTYFNNPIQDLIKYLDTQNSFDFDNEKAEILRNTKQQIKEIKEIKSLNSQDEEIQSLKIKKQKLEDEDI